MRLLDTKTRRVLDVTSQWVLPEYAILSHCWEEEEVSFRQMADSQMTDEAQRLEAEYGGYNYSFAEEFPLLAEMQRFHQRNMASRKGWRKIENFCQNARKRGFDYAWIDTCCIDKSSSSELQEAINSMWKWYERAGICIVYMHDVDALRPPGALSQDFMSSKWFARGWTLQELLAPEESRIYFVDRNWVDIGPHSKLKKWISEASRIPEELLDSSAMLLRQVSAATKMRWASTRQTTRPEDEAYCLLGLFGINMPLLYGEGRTAAFARLQLEILQKTGDESIFAWTPIESPSKLVRKSNLGMISPSSRCFGSVGGEIRLLTIWDCRPRPPSWMTHQGLQILLNLKQTTLEYLNTQIGHAEFLNLPTYVSYFMAPLKLEFIEGNSDTARTVFLAFVYRKEYPNIYFRLNGFFVDECTWSTFEKHYPPQLVYVK